MLNIPTGIFAKCHGHIPTNHYHTVKGLVHKFNPYYQHLMVVACCSYTDSYVQACIKRTCNCGSSLSQCLCVSLGSYAEACASLGVMIGDWRKATNCSELSFDKNIIYSICILTLYFTQSTEKSQCSMFTLSMISTSSTQQMLIK